jgi:hypothetical protein
VNKGIVSFVPQGWVFPLFMKVNHYGLVVLRVGSVDVFKFHVQCSDCRAEYVSYGLGVEYKVIFGVIEVDPNTVQYAQYKVGELIICTIYV